MAKNRYSGDLGVMALDFDKLGLSYAQKKKKSDDATKENVPNDSKLKDRTPIDDVVLGDVSNGKVPKS